MNIFQSTAPGLYAVGLAAIPLYPRLKKPSVNAWGLLSENEIENWKKTEWLENFPKGNIGCVMGARSGVIAVDLDSKDPRVIRALDRALGSAVSPWTRIGAKGSVRLFAYNPAIRTSRIEVMINGAKERVVEILAKGTQIVLPPSIHPDTGKAYTANCDLASVIDKVRHVQLPENIEARVRQELAREGLEVCGKGVFKSTDWVPKGTRDVAATQQAGNLARDVQRGARTFAEAVGEMSAWIIQYVARSPGDDIDVDDGIKKLVRFIVKDIEVGGKKLPVGWDKGLSADDKVKAREAFGLTTSELEQIPADMLVENLRLKLAEISENDYETRHQALSEVLDEVAKSNSLSEIQRTSIIAKISLWVKDMKLSPTVLGKEVRRRQASLMGVSDEGGFEGASHTEIARALAVFIEAQYGEIRTHSGRLWRWMGACWKHLEDDVVLQIIADNYGDKCPAARRFSDHKGILGVYRLGRPSELVVVEKRGANFANGVLGVDGVLVPHNPDFGHTNVLPYRYDPQISGNCPQFFNFLSEAWAGEEDFLDRIEALREAIALTLVGDTWRYEVAFCLYGPGATGKSTLMNIILGLVSPEDLCSCPPSDWADKHRPVQMVGKSVNLCGELDEKALISGKQFKTIVSGENITVEDKYVSAVTVGIKATHWFSTNHPPRTADTSTGFWRRWVFWTFNQVVAKKDLVVRLDHIILAEEREAIAAWAVEALPDILANQGMRQFDSCQGVVREVRKRSDSVLWFMEDFCESCPERILLMEIFAKYRSVIAIRGGGKPVSYLTFLSRLQEGGHRLHPDGKHLLGIKVKKL